MSRNNNTRKHTQELEKHRHRQDSKKLLQTRQDSFLKKFSTRRLPGNTTNLMTIISDMEATIEDDRNEKKSENENLNRLIQSQNNSPIIDYYKQSLIEKEPCLVIDEADLTKSVESTIVNAIEASDKDLTLSNKYENRKVKAAIKKHQKSLIPCSSLDSECSNSFDCKSKSKYKICLRNFLSKFNYFVLSPDSDCQYAWLIVANLCFLYNIWLIIFRQSFENVQIMFSFYWRIADFVSDFIYFLDILVQFRTGYLEQGLLVYDSKKLALNYLKSNKFLLDIFSLAPFELLEFYFGYSVPMLRFSRFLKFYRLMELFYIVESRTLYPNVVRVLLLISILLLLGHWFAGFYFLISKAEGFKGKNTLFFDKISIRKKIFYGIF